MRAYFGSILLSLSSLICFAQKPPIDSVTLKKWSFVSSPRISNNGIHVLYTIENHPIGKRTLVVLNRKKNSKLEVPGCTTSGAFTSDSKYVFFKKEKDSLGIISTVENIILYIPFVQSFRFSMNRNGTWLIYQLNNSQKALRIHNLENAKEKTFDFVQQYLLSVDDNILLFLTEEKKDSATQSLHLFDLTSGDLKTIWQGAKAGNFVFGRISSQLAFTVEKSIYSQTEKTFWYYKAGMEKAIELATNRSVENESTLKLENIVGFTEDDSSLFVTLKQKDFPKPLPSLVDIWSYTDIKLQSLQLKELDPKTYKAVINIQQAKLIRLEKEHERLMLPTVRGTKANHWGLILNTPGDVAEMFWNANAFISVFLISTRDGTRKRIDGLNDGSGNISPNGKYVIYYDRKQKSYFSYEIESGITRNLTKDISVEWLGYIKDQPASGPRGIAGWLENDEAVLIYDENDIWQIDMAGKSLPVNITNGYGKKHSIVFSLSMNNYNRTFSLNEKLIINAFNLDNKENGFYSKALSQMGDPELLTMGPYFYDIPGNPYIPSKYNFSPRKASQAGVFLVQRMKANEAPNIFSTTDFKTFTRLSDIHPEKNYNWLTAELVTWKALDGRSLQGILYKPENFDPQKKYPVIFHYYERKSDGLHTFLEPDFLSEGMNINIPWYVSNGYLVFLPDIYYNIGETGESAINSVVSAAQYLSKQPYVNPKKMGIQGGSFGGFETNYIVTHSNIFTAGCSASGLANLISVYGGLYETGASEQEIVEFTQCRIGATLWQRPDLYIKNSPVFRADQVTTPLLIMHTKQDGVSPFTNVLEFFTALRRLDKKVWMLQYEGNHGISGNSAIDFSTRLAQFFDHYLKDAPAPKWMIQGIPAKLRGIETGLELTTK